MNDVMTRRPMYRWKSFWLGILVMGFLGWAWERSHRVEESCSVVWAPFKGGGPNAVSLGQGWGRIHATVREDTFADPGIRIWVREINWELRDPVVIDFSKRGYHAMLVVAHWLVMVCFLVVWGGWLVWRWRREGRRSSATPAA